MAVKTQTIPWNDGTSDNLYVSWDDSQLPGTAKVTLRSDSNRKESQRSINVVFTTNAPGASKQVSETLPVTQRAGVKTYADPVINLSYPKVSAAGGTVTPVMSYSQTWGWNGETTGGGTITSGGTIEYSGTGVNTVTGAVNVPSLGTTSKAESVFTTSTVTVTVNGKTATKSFEIIQGSNSETLSDISISAKSSNIPSSIGKSEWIAASGGTFTLTCMANYSYTSGASANKDVTSDTTFSQQSGGFATDISGNVATIPSRGTTEGADRYTVFVASYQGKTANVSTGQEANIKTQIGISIDKLFVDDSWVSPENWSSAPAWHCHLAIQGYRNYAFTSGSNLTEPILNAADINDIKVITSVPWAIEYPSTYKGHSIQLLTRGTEIGEARSGTVKWEYDGFTSNELYFTQIANNRESYTNRSDLTYTLSPTVAPGNGGNVTCSNCRCTATCTYTSGASQTEGVPLYFESASSHITITSQTPGDPGLSPVNNSFVARVSSNPDYESTRLGFINAYMMLNGSAYGDSFSGPGISQEPGVRPHGNMYIRYSGAAKPLGFYRLEFYKNNSYDSVNLLTYIDPLESIESNYLVDPAVVNSIVNKYNDDKLFLTLLAVYIDYSNPLSPKRVAKGQTLSSELRNLINGQDMTITVSGVS